MKLLGEKCMKKKLIMFSLIFVCLFSVFALAGCGNNDNKTPPEHTHEYNNEWSMNSTHHWYSCLTNGCDKTKDKKDFVLKNDLDNAIEVEQKLYEKELLGKDTPILNNSISSTNDVDTIRAQITEFIKSLTPPQKTEMKKKLTDAGLPTAFKSVTDVVVLQKVLDTIKA